MPDTSTIKKFLTAVRTRQTNTTKALDSLFSQPADRAPHLPALAALNPSVDLPPPARAVLTNEGLSPAEIDHIDAWPGNHKDAARNALISPANANRRVYFFWELHDGSANETAIEDDGHGDIIITFRSPDQNVSVALPDQINVSV